jgi:iron complex outermembrane receptor protein
VRIRNCLFVSGFLGALTLVHAGGIQAQTAQVAPANDVAGSSGPAGQGGANTPAGDEALQEITVTGYRAALEAAQKEKRNAAQVVEAITPEDLGKFTDNSIADELQRVPGVQIDRGTDGRSGDHVSIRGMGSEFITTTVNGRTPGSWGSEGLINLREFAVDVLPSEILSGVLIYKTPSAELVESGLGGEVDFRTLKPLDYKPKSGEQYFGSITAKTQNNSTEPTWGKGVSGLFGGTLLDGTLGFYIAGVLSTNPLREDFDEVRPQIDTVNVRNATGGVSQQQVIFPSYPDFGMMRKVEDRDALSTDIQWKPNDAVEFNVDYTFSKYDRTDNRDYNTLLYDGGNVLNGVFEPGGITIQNGAVTGLNFAKYTPPAGAGGSPTQVTESELPLIYDSNATTQIGGLNGKWHNDKWSAALDLSANKMRFLQNLGLFYAPSIGYPSYAGVNYSANASGPSTFNQGAPPLTDPSLFSTDAVFQRFVQSINQGGAAKFDLVNRFNDNITFKAGLRYSQTDVDVRSVSYYGAVNPTQSQALQHTLYPGGIDTIFPGWNFGMNAQPVQNPAGAFNSSANPVPPLNFKQPPFTGSFFGSINAPGPYTTDATHSHANQEDTEAAYVQMDAMGPLMGVEASGNVGLRVVYTTEDAKAFQTITYVDANNFQTGPSVLVPIETKYHYTNFLPSANLTLHPEDSMNVRFAVARTLSRPEYEDMSPINVVSIPDPKLASTTPNSRGTGTVGNPYLKPETAWNFDATFEYYPGNGASFVASVFYKLVSDFISPVTVYNATAPGQGSQLFNLTDAENISGGKAYGAELGFNQPLRSFLEALDGFGVQANYTLVESSIDQPISGRVFTFPGSSRSNVNGTVYYNKGPIDMRVAVAYRSNYLSALPWVGVVNFPTFTDGYTTVDASATYSFGRHLDLTVTGSNLTEAGRRDYTYETSNFLNYYTRPRTVALALRASF